MQAPSGIRYGAFYLTTMPARRAAVKGGVYRDIALATPALAVEVSL